MVSLLALGLGSLKFKIPLEVFPSIEPRVVIVSVSVPGATPEEMESSVSIKLEESVQDLEGIDTVSSTSSENQSSMQLQLKDNYDPQEMLADIKNRIDAINNLPSLAERPLVNLAKRKREVISIAVAGDVSEVEIRQQAEQIRDQLLQIEGISQVELDGVRAYEIAIEIEERILQQYELGLTDIAAAIERSSQDISAGSLKTDGGEVLIRSTGQAYTQQDFADIIILARPDGGVVRLSELAKIKDTFSEVPIVTRFNGQRAAFVDIYRVGQESAIDVADKVMLFLESKADSLPSDVRLTPWRDRSKIVKKRIKTLTDNAFQGGILVLVLLTLFLRPAIAFWVCLGIPVSFMGAFLLMPFFGITLNVISLFGFIVILGVVVDDAIVTGENIYTHLRCTEDSLDAVINGTKEVAIPVTFGILTTVAAFLPIAFIEGVRGQLFAAIPVVVIPILLFSLIESKLVLPAHLKHLNLHKGQQRNRFEVWQQAFADGFEQGVIRYYQPLLNAVLNHRYLFLAFAVATLILLYAILSSGWMRFIFFPKVQSEVARASLIMPNGTPFEVTDKFVLHILDAAEHLQEKYIDTDPETGVEQAVIRNILATSGSGSSASGSHFGRVLFEIVAPEDRRSTITSRELVNEWRQLVGDVPGADSLSYRAEIGRVSDPIDIQLKGLEFESLANIAEQIKVKLASYPSVFDIEDSFSDGKEALEVRLKPQAHAAGFSRQQVVGQIREAFYGFEVQRIQRGRDDIRVMLRYPEKERRSIQSLNQFLVRTSAGIQVPLSQIAELLPENSPATIHRIDGKRTIDVTADIDKKKTNMLLLQKELRAFIDPILAQTPGVSYTMEGEAKEQRQSFGSLKWGLLFVIFIIYSLLAIPFKSYWQPIIVMMVIPFGVIGSVGGHWLMGMDLTLISLLGMLALTGIVVNDSLVLVDFVNKRRLKGEAISLAIRQAAAARFRPVILTSLTTFLGLMPLLFEESTQAQFLIPMAVSLGFGILFATLITLLLVPVNYLVIEDIKARLGASQG